MGGRGQRTQCHLGVGVDLCIIINRISAESSRRTYIRNASDNGIESSQRLEICRGSGVKLVHRSVCISDCVYGGFYWTGSGLDIRYVFLFNLNVHNDVLSRYLNESIASALYAATSARTSEVTIV